VVFRTTTVLGHREAWPAFQIMITVITASLVCKASNFHACVGLWGVNHQITIRRLLAIVMIAGLVLSPLSSPVMAGTMGDAAMSAMASDMSMFAAADEMASDMPCCPAKAPVPIGCDKCVFMAACMSKCFTGMSSIVFHPWLTASADVVALRNDSWPDGLGHPPPEHPPRTLV
jgi:hypothetical protein